MKMNLDDVEATSALRTLLLKLMWRACLPALLALNLTRTTFGGEIAAVFNSPTQGTLDGVAFTVSGYFYSNLFSPYVGGWDVSGSAFSAAPLSKTQQAVSYFAGDTIHFTFASEVHDIKFYDIVFRGPSSPKADTQYDFGTPITILSGNQGASIVNGDTLAVNNTSYFSGILELQGGITEFTITPNAQDGNYQLFTLAVDRPSAVPEPSSFALLSLGGWGLAISAIRQRRRTLFDSLLRRRKLARRLPKLLKSWKPKVVSGLVIATLILLTGSKAIAGSISIAPFGTTYSEAYAVDGGNVVGSYRDPVSGYMRGFLYDGNKYTTIIPPGGQVQAQATGVSGGNIVGNYDPNYSSHAAFLFNGTTYTTLPLFASSPVTVYGISRSNIVGSFSYLGKPNGFLYNGHSYTLLAPFGSKSSSAVSVSGNNVVGSYTDPVTQLQVGYLYSGSNYISLDPFNSRLTFAYSVSGNNVVGSYLASNGSTFGYLFNGKTFATLDPFNSTSVSLERISGNNIAGSYLDPVTGNTYGFLYDGTKYTSIDPFGSTNVQVLGISDDHVVGYYLDPVSGNQYGFLYDPSTVSPVPEPSSVVLASLGGVVLVIRAYRRRRVVI